MGDLDEVDLASGWFEQLQAWFAQATADPRTVEPNAVQLATADASGHPSVRTVLVKALDERGIVFYTGYESAKGRELAQNPYASAVFAWLAQERQVRLTGRVRRVSRAETEAYFAGRPRGSQIAAWASPQSAVLDSREVLRERVRDVEARFDGVDVVPAPPNWGGFLLAPDTVEFWQGRADRLHDRFRYRPVAGGWQIDRLAP